jgi:hypothetical protein
VSVRVSVSVWFDVRVCVCVCVGVGVCECVCVSALIMQHATRCHIVICGVFCSTIFLDII